MSRDAHDAHYEVVIGGGAAGERLDRALAAGCEGVSRVRIKALIEAGRVHRAGASVMEADYRVKPGERYVVTLPPAESPSIEAQAIALDVCYEDAEVIVVDKPAGMVVHPAPGNPDRTLVNALIARCGDSLKGIGGVRRPGIVHRLDKDTSGLIIAAKTAHAHASLSAQFAARSVGRSYTAFAWGAPAATEGVFEGAIGRHPVSRKKMAVVARGGRPALTRYRVEAVYRWQGRAIACRLTLKLATGRTHQIRVHLAHAGHPIIGDPNYGGARRKPPLDLPLAARAGIDAMRRQALHAVLLAIDHPVTGERLSFRSPLPRDMARLEEALHVLEA